MPLSRLLRKPRLTNRHFYHHYIIESHIESGMIVVSVVSSHDSGAWTLRKTTIHVAVLWSDARAFSVGLTLL